MLPEPAWASASRPTAVWLMPPCRGAIESRVDVLQERWRARAGREGLPSERTAGAKGLARAFVNGCRAPLPSPSGSVRYEGTVEERNDYERIQDAHSDALR